MSILSQLLSPQAMNQEAMMQGNVGRSLVGSADEGSGFWDKLQAFYDSPSGFGAISGPLDYYVRLGMQQPQFHYPQRSPQVFTNPGAVTLGNLIQAMTGRGF